jgi:hypothetical protein
VQRGEACSVRNIIKKMRLSTDRSECRALRVRPEG